MKKFLSFVVFTVIVGLWASATDRFYIEDFLIAPGETRTVSIMLVNDTAYTAFQSDLYLPDGLMATNFALTARKNSTHTLTATVLPDGGIRLLSYSLKLKTYSGNSGALVTFDVTASEEFEGPVTIELRNTMFTTSSGQEIAFGNEMCTVNTPSSVMRGDVNGNGTVNMDDLTALINYLVFGSPINFANAAACNNADDTTVVNMDDLTTLINYLVFNQWP